MSDTASLLPPNASPTERAIEQSTARLGSVATPLRKLWNPATCPVEWLPWLAWALAVDNWRPEWPEYIKRARIAAAIEIQRHKGTVKSVKDTVASFGGSIDVVEWWQKSPRGIPHTFDVSVALSGFDGEPATAQFTDDVMSGIDRVKPVRSHYTVTQGFAMSGAVGVTTYARAAVLVRLELTEETS